MAKETQAARNKRSHDLKKRQSTLAIKLGQALEEPPFVSPSKNKKANFLSKTAVALTNENIVRK